MSKSAAWAAFRSLIRGPKYRGPRSDHFDGQRFFSPDGPPPHSFRDFLRWRRTSTRGPWPDWVDVPPAPPPPREVRDGARITWVNHSTLLIQTKGVNLLTDPIWSYRCSPVSFTGPRRHRPPGVKFDDLPPVHVVLLSHNHYDHLDLPTLRRLADQHRPQFIVPLGDAPLLRSIGVDAEEWDWWQESEINGLTISSVPAQHFAARGLRDRDRTLWCGYAIDTRSPQGWIYFAGDTGYAPLFARIRERLGPPAVAMLPIGGFKPRWFMGPLHMAPEEAMRAFHDLGQPRTSIPIHFGTFPLADDGDADAPDELRAALANDAVAAERFQILQNGQHVLVP